LVIARARDAIDVASLDGHVSVERAMMQMFSAV
jgi:hypothetical protein